MLRSSTLGSVRPSGSILAALLLCALSVAGAGCEKDGGPTAGSPAVKEEAREAPAGAAPSSAPAATAAADPGAATSAAAVANPSAAADPGAAKGDPGKVAAGGRVAGTDPAVAGKEGAVAAEPAPAAPPSAPAAPEAAAPTAAAAAETATPTQSSPKVGESNFSVWMQAGKVKAGQQGVVEVVLIPKNGFHCNENYPYKIKMNDPPAGVSFPQAIVRKEGMSVSASRGVMRVPFVASAAGDAKIAGKFSFSVCTSDQCLIDSRDLAMTVKVE